jgi:hypothetical protein
VRCITRLDETCREVRDAARVIGDARLFKKMEEAQLKIKRDSKSKQSKSTMFSSDDVKSCLCRQFVFLGHCIPRDCSSTEFVCVLS